MEFHVGPSNGVNLENEKSYNTAILLRCLMRTMARIKVEASSKTSRYDATRTTLHFGHIRGRRASEARWGLSQTGLSCLAPARACIRATHSTAAQRRGAKLCCRSTAFQLVLGAYAVDIFLLWGSFKLPVCRIEETMQSRVPSGPPRGLSVRAMAQQTTESITYHRISIAREHPPPMSATS